MKKILRLFLVLFLIVLISGAAIIALSVSKLPLNNYPENTSFEIPEGSVQREVFSLLEDNNIIKDDTIAYYYSRLLKPADFKAGIFTLPQGLNLDTLIDYLSDGNNVLKNTVNITLYEDDNISMMAKRISEKTNLTYDELFDYWNNEEVVKGLIDEYQVLTDDILNPEIYYPLEGYLSPNTYEFYENTNVEDVTKRLLDQTENYYLENKSSFDNNEYSIHELFTLASIIQYESSDQMDMVSGVFYNRLAGGMAFQSTVTACYGAKLSKEECALIGDTNKITKDEYNAYNTYHFYGFPVGPVLCPGKDALNAALHPADNEYFYFIGAKCGDKAGETVFAENLALHNVNIEEYIASCK